MPTDRLMTDWLISSLTTLSAMVVNGTWLSTCSRYVFSIDKSIRAFNASVASQTYGLVPQPVYPESYHSSLSGPINSLLKMKLREHALTLRALSASLRADPSISPELGLSTLRAKKEELMQEVYTVMTATLGIPPKPDASFTWEYYTEDGKYAKWEGTPLQFYKAFTTKYSVSAWAVDNVFVYSQLFSRLTHSLSSTTLGMSTVSCTLWTS
jgi:hypothetical protein